MENSLFRSLLVWAILMSVESIAYAEPDEVITQFGYATRSDSAFKRREFPKELSLEEAITRAAEQLAYAKEKGDERGVGRARAYLEIWWANKNMPADFLALKADIQQYDHEFDQAIQTLRELTAGRQNNDNAHLSLANVLVLRGKYSEAETSCSKILQEDARLICQAQVEGYRAAPKTAAENLLKKMQRLPTIDAQIAAWAASLLADLYSRCALWKMASEYGRAAYELSPGTRYYKVQYADILLATGANQAVINLLGDVESDRALLLRLGIAKKRAGILTSSEQEILAMAFGLESKTDHLREAAMYYLFIKDNPGAALKLASQNIRAQKEFVDIFLWGLAAKHAGDAISWKKFQDWQAKTGYIDLRIMEEI